MALDTARLASEMDSMIADLPVTVTFGNETFLAAMTRATVAADIEEGGFLPQRDIGLHAKVTALTKTLKVGSKLSVNAQGIVTLYRVMTIERSTDGQEFLISCQSHRR